MALIATREFARGSLDGWMVPVPEPVIDREPKTVLYLGRKLGGTVELRETLTLETNSAVPVQTEF